MSSMPRGPAPLRSAVVDLGSNSVRLVVFEGITRNPIPIFNEKVTLRLGRGLETTGCLNEEGLKAAPDVLRRFNAIARSMKADPFTILATAAVRDARNGPAFIAQLHDLFPNIELRVLSGKEEADYAAAGVLCGIPNASGLAADIGGGSLELIHLDEGKPRKAVTCPLGAIRLSDRAGGDISQAKSIIQGDLKAVTWLNEAMGKTLYLVGGAFRALARLQIARVRYPLNMVHLFTLTHDDAIEMADWLADTPRKALEKLPDIPRKRLDDVPWAANVLKHLLRETRAKQVVFSVDGVREGWYMRHVAASVAHEDPCYALAEETSRRLGRSVSLSQALIAWTANVFPDTSENMRRVRELSCRLSDTGSFDHPEYRAVQTFFRVLRMHGVGFDHPSRAAVAICLAIRYGLDRQNALLAPARDLLSESEIEHAIRLGGVLQLAYALCGGTLTLLEGSSLEVRGGKLRLTLTPDAVSVSCVLVRRKLDKMAQWFGLQSEICQTSAHKNDA